MKKRIVSITLACVILAISGFVIAHSINGNGAADSERIEDYDSIGSRQIVFGSRRIFAINADDVSRIEVARGATGERAHVEDRDEIARIVKDMNNIQYSEKETLSEIWLGFFLRITLYDNSNQIITSLVPRGNALEVNGDLKYTLVRPSPFDNVFHARYFD